MKLKAGMTYIISKRMIYKALIKLYKDNYDIDYKLEQIEEYWFKKDKNNNEILDCSICWLFHRCNYFLEDKEKMIIVNELWSALFGNTFTFEILAKFQNSKDHTITLIRYLQRKINDRKYSFEDDGLFEMIGKSNNSHSEGVKMNKFDEIINNCIELLYENFNLILTGAPGTGKTYLAMKIAEKICEKNKKGYDFIQFHPSYDYTDFIEGLRPYEKENADSVNTIGFKLENGIFKKFCKEALENQERDYVFIIDEINRGEISKIFGELFFSIEPSYRGKKGKVKTQYANIQTEKDEFDSKLGSGWFYIPKNVFIIGTMNDIDRSVESFDFAMRRRFIWKEIKAIDSVKYMGLPKNVIVKINILNNAISKIEGLNSSYHIGGSYFLCKGKPVDLDDMLWELRLEPLLREYLRGIPDAEIKLSELREIYYDNNIQDVLE